jgi:hypothetical protein
MSEEGFLLSTDNARNYLAGRGLLHGEEEAAVCALGGGVSNSVLLVDLPGN